MNTTLTSFSDLDIRDFTNYFNSQKPTSRKDKQFYEERRRNLYVRSGEKFTDYFWWDPKDAEVRLDFLKHLRKKRKN